MGRGPATLGAALLSVALVLLGAGTPDGAAAASGGTTNHRPVLQLTSQTTWVTDGSTFDERVALRGAGDTSGLVLQMAVFSQLRSRSAFAASQRGRGLGGALWSESSSVDQLPASGGSYDLCVPVDVAPPPDCDASAPIHLGGAAYGPGVYPVVVTLRRRGSGSYIDQLVTHLVLVPAAPAGARLSLALVVPVAAASPLQPDGSRRLDAGTVARLAGVGGLLAGRGDAALTMAPDPATLAALADTGSAPARAVLSELRRAAAGVQVMGQPFAPLAPYDLVDAGLSGELSAHIQRGADIVRTELGAHTNPTTWLTTGPLDGPTANALRGVGVTRLVVSTDELQSTGTNRTPSQPYTLDVEGNDIPAVVQDDALGADLAGADQSGADPVLAAHELLADLAQTYFEAPNAVRGVVAVAPRLWRPSRQAAGIVLGGLADSPILSTSTLDDLFAGVPSAPGDRLAAFPGRRPLLPASRIRNDRADQAALSGSVTELLPAAVSMNDLVLESEAAGLSRSARNAYLSGAEAVLAEQLQMVSVVHSAVTLTSRKATVPISVQSLLPVPVTVRVTVSSDNLEFANGRDSLVLSVQTLRQQNTTFLVPVTARTTGSFALRVSIVTANGGLTLTSERLTINSRVFSGVGVGLSAGALVFLALWWGRELRKGRRAKPAPAPPVEHVRRREPAGAAP